jgi:hypothetical protein
MLILILYLTIVCCLGFPAVAYAYLDPGTGSVILQGLAAILLIGGMFWRRVYGFLKKPFANKKREPKAGQ